MKKLNTLLFSSILALSTLGVMTSCNDDKPSIDIEDSKIEKIELEGFKTLYKITDTVDFSKITLKVTYHDDTEETISDIEFDVEVSNAKESTKAIIYTDGLKAETAGALTAKEYAFKVRIIGEEEDRDLGKVLVSNDQSNFYDAFSFMNPKFVTAYKQNTTITPNDESSFYFNDEKYIVGDDNPFEFRPELKLVKKNSTEITPFEPIDYNVDFKLSILNGDTFIDADSKYYTYEDFKVDFTEEAIGKTFKLESKLHDFKTDMFGNAIDPVSFVVTVEDGYNVYDAIDLGRLNLVSPEGVKKIEAEYDRKNSSNIFYNPTTKKRTKIKYWELWDKFFKEREIPAEPIKGLFLQGDIRVTPADLPSEYFISEEEQAVLGRGNTKLVGTLRDHAYLYSGYTLSNLSVNGNYFKLDFEDIPWQQTNTGYDGFYYKPGETNYLAGHTAAFAFIGKEKVENEGKIPDEEGYIYNYPDTSEVTFKNMEIIGNTKNITKGDEESDIDPMLASGGLIFLKSMYTDTKVTNAIAKSFMIAWFSERNQTRNALELDYVKTYDCFNSGCYNWHTRYNKVTNSEFKRFGGPAFFGTSSVRDEDGTKHINAAAGWQIDDKTIIESYLNGEEAWFNLMKAGAIASEITGLQELLNYYNVKFINDSGENKGKFNVKFVCLEDGQLTSSENILYIDYSEGNEQYKFNIDEISKQIGAIHQQEQTKKAPILLGGQGGAGIIAPVVKDLRVFNILTGGAPALVQPGSKEALSMFKGQNINITYPIGSTAIGITLGCTHAEVGK